VRTCDHAVGGLAAWLAFKPHLVFVDFEMPEVSGATFIKIVRAQEPVVQRRTALLMVTGYSDREHVLAARDAGADGFIVKPLEPELILQRSVKALAEIPDDGVLLI